MTQLESKHQDTALRHQRRNLAALLTIKDFHFILLSKIVSARLHTFWALNFSEFVKLEFSKFWFEAHCLNFSFKINCVFSLQKKFHERVRAVCESAESREKVAGFLTIGFKNMEENNYYFFCF